MVKFIVNFNLQNLKIEKMSQLDIKIGPKIKAFRRQLGLQANKLSEELGISPSYLNLIESGKRKIDGD
jgi:ribosome-binding protein aMBF1 (putative translation factor)